MSPLAWPPTSPAEGPVRLRPYRDTDLDLIRELALDPYVPLIGTVPTPFTEVEGLAYLARQHERLADGARWSFAIAERATDRAVGGAGLWLHDDGPATAGYVLAASARGHGYAAAALRALTHFAWHQAHLDRVELFIEPWNLASLRVAERCGYRRLELHPRHTAIDGTLRDMWRYRIDRAAGSTG